MRRTAVVVLMTLLGCEAGQPADDLTTVEQRVLAPLPLPGTPGHGANVRVTCAAPSGNCQANQILSIAQAAAALNSIGAPPAAPFTATRVYSFEFNHPVDWSDLSGSTSFFAGSADMNQLFGRLPHRVAYSFSGYVAIPADKTTKSFAVGSDDGYYFAISNGASVMSSARSTIRPFAYGDDAGRPLTVTFPTAGLYPFYLLYWENDGVAGVELAWADGTTTALPASRTNTNGYSVVPAASLYAPDVRVSSWFTDVDHPAGTIVGSDVLEFTVSATNDGPVALGAHALVFPVDNRQLRFVTPPAGCTVSTASTTDTLRCGGLPALAPGATETLAVRVQLQNLAPGTAIDVQPAILGLATEPEVVANVATAAGLAGNTSSFADVFRLANDAVDGSGFSVTDTGNAPAVAVGAAAGRGDDDATHLVVGAPVPLPAPVITAPPSPSSSTAPVTIAGTSSFPSGRSVTVAITSSAGAATSCAAIVQPGGAWSCAPLALRDGSYTLVARTVNAGNGVGPPSAPYALVMSPPALPVVTQPARGAVNTSRVAFGGTSADPAGAHIQVDVVSTAAAAAAAFSCTATVQAGGSWACSITLPDGAYMFSAAGVEAAGPLGPATAPRSLLVDTVPPPAPSLEAPRSPNNSAPLPLRGTGEPGATVTVFEGATAVCSGVADAAGRWTCAASLADGAHTVRAVAADTAGNASPPSASASFTLDTVAPAPPQIAAQPGVSKEPRPTFQGTAEPGSVVTVSSGGVPLCTATAAAGGAWSCRPVDPLPDGHHADVGAVAADAAGNQSAPAPFPSFFTKSKPPDAPAITSPGNGAEVEGTVVIRGTTEPDATVTVFLDGVSAGTVTADQNGGWSLQPTGTVGFGSHVAAAQAVDLAGNQGPRSSDVSFSRAIGGHLRGGCSTAPSAGPLAVLLLALWWRRRP